MTLYEEPGLAGLELWHGIVDGQCLADMPSAAPAYFGTVCRFLLDIHSGTAVTQDPSDTQALRRATQFAHVVLSGGDASSHLLASALSEHALPFTWEVDDSGPFAARRGALRIFTRMGWRDGVALDLGQTSLKIITRNGCRVIPRDWDRLPLGAGALDSGTGRTRLRQFLRVALEPHAGADGVALGLPVALDSAGLARPATYPGLSGTVIAWLADLFPPGSVALNDAVLAAAGFPPPAGQKRLVLTLGFGIGGALWDR